MILFRQTTQGDKMKVDFTKEEKFELGKLYKERIILEKRIKTIQKEINKIKLIEKQRREKVISDKKYKEQEELRSIANECYEFYKNKFSLDCEIKKVDFFRRILRNSYFQYNEEKEKFEYDFGSIKLTELLDRFEKIGIHKICVIYTYLRVELGNICKISKRLGTNTATINKKIDYFVYKELKDFFVQEKIKNEFEIIPYNVGDDKYYFIYK